jgi:hypothetical protein
MRWHDLAVSLALIIIACVRENDGKVLLGDAMAYDAMYEAVDCKLGDWGVWAKCSQICGGGVQERFRTVLVPASGLGAKCVSFEANTVGQTADLTQLRPCNVDPCPAHCETTFDMWIPCSKTCGGGTQTAPVSSITAVGGKGCAYEKDRICNEFPCREYNLFFQ